MTEFLHNLFGNRKERIAFDLMPKDIAICSYAKTCPYRSSLSLCSTPLENKPKLDAACHRLPYSALNQVIRDAL